MSWKSFPKRYAGFSRAERYGIAGLCGCILLVLIVRLCLPHWVKHQAPDTSAYENEIALFRQAVDSVQAAKSIASVEPTDAGRLTAELFYFDPNTATDKDWERLGMTSRQIRTIRNYQAKGGHFRKKEDVGKLYTVSVTQYKLLEPYILIAGEASSSKKQPEKQPETVPAKENAPVADIPARTLVHIDLNVADSSELTRLSGIGPVLASRIVKYRNRIGGFADAAQLSEVYGIKPELVEKLTPQLSADRSLIRKIAINTATFKDLVSHPYIGEQQTKGILNYKKLQGRINGLDELVRNNILTREEADKIEPYISFGE